jgi:hypothetical protein
MNWEAIGALAELGGALGVIASLVYLGIQIRQNTHSAREATWHSVLRDLQQFRSLIAQDPEIARVYREGLRDMKSLNDDDRWRFGALMQSLYSVFELVFRARDESQFQHYLDDLAWTAGRPGARDWWSKAKRLYSPDFQRFVDETLESSRKPPSHPAA